MEKYRFFDAVEDENGVYDREYNAQEFTDYFKALVTTGIMKGAGNELAVSTSGSSMITSIDTGIAFILGRYYENDSPLELTHDTETLGHSRIDRIVIRMDLSTEARYVKAFIKKGVASTSPVAPTLTQTPNFYEISLAQVKIVGGQTYIGVNDVTDERGIDVICPWAGSNILPNFNDEALGQLINDVENLKTLDNPILATLNTGWGHRLTSQYKQPLAYYKDPFGIVHVSGILQNNSATSSIITTLPVGYRPLDVLSLGFIAESGTGVKTMDIIRVDANGNVSIPTATKYAYININFRVDLEASWWL